MWYLINYQQPDANKIYLYIKDKFESKYRLLIKRREKTDIEIKNVKYPKAFFVDDSQIIDDVYENFEDYNPTNKRKVLVVFDDMLADNEANTKLSPIVNELS